MVPHLKFVPEIDDGVTVNRLAQSQKWREGLSREMRVPMVEVSGQHYYIYEPAQLSNGKVVVPVFFYSDTKCIRAKCVSLRVDVIDSQDVQTYVMKMSAEPESFSAEGWIDVAVVNFVHSFFEIELENGSKLLASGGKKIYR